MENITIFEKEEFGKIRVTGTFEKPLFCATDVARALGYSNPAKAIIDHCKGVSVLVTPTDGGNQKMKYISESDVYRLIFKSKAPNADTFNIWVAEEVLPSIRKTGGYSINNNQMSDSEIMSRALVIAYQTLNERQERIEKLEKRNRLISDMHHQEKERADYHRVISQKRMDELIETKVDLQFIKKELADAQPAIDFSESVMENGENCLVGTLAKMISQCNIEIGRARLFKWLRDNNYVGKVGNNKNIPHQRYVGCGLFVVKEADVETNSGEHIVRITPMVTPKGQQYFVNKFRRLRAEGKI